MASVHKDRKRTCKEDGRRNTFLNWPDADKNIFSRPGLKRTFCTDFQFKIFGLGFY